MAEADIAFVAAAGAAGLALSVCAWAWRLRNRLTAREAAVEHEAATGASALAEREGALSAFEDIRIGLTYDGGVTTLLGAAETIAAARAALAPEAGEDDAVALAVAVHRAHPVAILALAERGEPCDLRIETAQGAWAVEGRAFGGAAWLKLFPAQFSNGGAAPAGIDAGLGLLADASPSPTWVVDAAGQLVWANRAWLAEVKAATLDEARAANLSFDRGAEQLLAEAGRVGARQEGFRWTAGGGRRRAWRIVAEPLLTGAPGSGGAGAVLAFAIDMTEAEETRDTLRRHVEAHDETLNHLADAVAIFGPSKRLAFHNTAFQTLFNIDPAWLDERPTHAELLDRLRQKRQLPEVIDYAGWKANELEFYGAAEAAPDDS